MARGVVAVGLDERVAAVPDLHQPVRTALATSPFHPLLALRNSGKNIIKRESRYFKVMNDFVETLGSSHDLHCQ